MTKILIMAFLLAFASAAQAQKISFEAVEVNYGDIVKGSDGQREFKFKNTGTAPLVIESAVPSCGCTVPDYPREPIMPGESRTIRVKYNTQNVGAFNKNITIKSNSIDNSQTTLTIRGNVQEEAPATPLKDKRW